MHWINASALHCLDFKRERSVNEGKTIEKSLKEAQDNLNAALAKAQESGERIAVLKSAGEIQEEMGLTDGHLAALTSVSEEIERQYESYSKLYLELKEKAQLVAENREKTLEEVKTRMAAWRTVMEELLTRVNVEYQRIMGQTLATGEVKLSNAVGHRIRGLRHLCGLQRQQTRSIGCLYAERRRTNHRNHGLPLSTAAACPSAHSEQ